MLSGGREARATWYLSFNGQCREASGFYAKTLGGTIEFIADYGGSPMADMVPESRHRAHPAKMETATSLVGATRLRRGQGIAGCMPSQFHPTR